LKSTTIAAIAKGFMSKGFTSTEALKKAYQAIDYSVMKQKSTVLS
jgi:DHA2 family multidrug resistance protein